MISPVAKLHFKVQFGHSVFYNRLICSVLWVCAVATLPVWKQFGHNQTAKSEAQRGFQLCQKVLTCFFEEVKDMAEPFGSHIIGVRYI